MKKSRLFSQSVFWTMMKKGHPGLQDHSVLCPEREKNVLCSWCFLCFLVFMWESVSAALISHLNMRVQTAPAAPLHFWLIWRAILPLHGSKVVGPYRMWAKMYLKALLGEESSGWSGANKN
jgi:hypothetical protein